MGDMCDNEFRTQLAVMNRMIEKINVDLCRYRSSQNVN